MRTPLLALLGAAALLLLPHLAYPLFLVKVLCFVLAACAFNLLLGGVGLLSLGHAAFFGGGAYFCGWLLTARGLPPALAVPLAVLASTAIGAMFGWLCVRRQGMFFSMVTLALAQFAYFLYSQVPFTGGENGLQGVPRGSFAGVDLSSDLNLYHLVLAVVALSLWAMHRMRRSPFGLAMDLVRSNEQRALSLGYDATSVKWTVFTVSSFFTALAGSLKVLAVQFASLTDVHFEMSGEILMMAVIGGTGSLAGAALGAAFLLTVQEYAAGLGGWVQAIQGAAFAATVLFFPGGLLGALHGLGAVLRWTRAAVPHPRPSN